MSLARFYCCSCKQNVMRDIIHDQASHKFIEGPIQSIPVNSIYQEGIAEKAAYQVDLTQGYEVEGDDNDIDIPYYEVNDRFD